MEESISRTSAVTVAPRVPAQRGEPPADHAARYAEERHWDVVPGTWLDMVDGVPRCSCGERACTAPGAHPASTRWAGEATGSATVARRLWAENPRASVLLPTGRTFDVVDVPESAGCLALARMERWQLSLGPIASSPEGRMLFFVLPGAAAKVPDLVRRLGWAPAALDLRTRGEGSWMAAPPTRVGTKGQVRWARHPTSVSRWLPDVETLLPPLAYACGREKITVSAR